MLVVVLVCLPVLEAPPRHSKIASTYKLCATELASISWASTREAEQSALVLTYMSQMVAGVLCAELVCAAEEPWRCCALGHLLSCAGQHP